MQGKIERVHPDLLSKLSEVEKELGINLTITSGKRPLLYRFYNTVRKKSTVQIIDNPFSYHIGYPFGPGLAVDLRISEFSRETIEKLRAALVKRGLFALDEGTHIHTDLRYYKKINPAWYYYGLLSLAAVTGAGGLVIKGIGGRRGNTNKA